MRAYGSAENMVLTERFTRVGEQAMEYEFILNDPSTFTDQIRGIVHFSRLNAPIYEFACHEGNYALTNMLRGKRLEELRAEGMLAETGSAWHRRFRVSLTSSMTA